MSRLNHRFIVRYYTTWVETSEPASTAASSESDRDTETVDGDTSVPDSRSRGSVDPFLVDLDDLGSTSRHSFPSIHFTRSGSADPEKGSESASSAESDGDGAFNGLFSSGPILRLPVDPAPTVSRTLYIQMVWF